MKKRRKLQFGRTALTGVMSMLLMFVLVLAFEPFSIVSHAESKAKVTANSANIRKEPNASSTVLGSTEKDKEISIKSQTTGSDGTVWYQVYVNSETLGYIRSDLVSITDGTTPPTETAPSTGAGTGENATVDNTTPQTNETPVAVTAVQPVSASATGGQSIRVRANASTTSQIVTTAKEGLALTVTGQATGTDGNTWYQVTFIDNGAEVTGFIRSDYVTLSGELVPVTDTPPAEGEGEQPAEPEPPVEEKKDWDTQLQGDTWYLINNVESKQYSIQQIFDVAEQNAASFEAEQKTVKTQKIVIVILVLAVVLLAAGVAFLIFKMKDSADSAFFSQVEKETIRKRAERPQGAGGQRVMHSVGGAKASGTGQTGVKQSVRPGQPARTAGKPGQTARPAGQPGQMTRPAGQPGQTARPAGQMTRQAGKQAGAPVQGARPAGASGQGGRPAGQPGQTVRQAGAQGQSVKPQGRPVQTVRKPDSTNPGWKSKNFMADDDEFEFEFLNWDGDEEQ